MTANIHGLERRHDASTRNQHSRDQHSELLAELVDLADDDRRAVLISTALTRPAETERLARLASAVRYLEPALVPVAAAVWLHNLMLMLR